MIKLLKFFSPTCSPCREMDRALEQLAFEFDLDITPFNIKEEMDSSIQWQIRTVPTLVNQETEARFDGSSTYEAVEEWLHAQARLQP